MTEALLRAGFEHVACDHCGSWEAEPYAELEDWLCELPGNFQMVRCARCGLLRLDPRPDKETIGRYYPDEYKPFTDTSTSPALLRNGLHAWSVEYGLRRRVRAVARFQPDGRLLDVGCASGLFLDAARRLGEWQVQGVEPNSGAAAFGRQQRGLDIRQGAFAEVDFRDGSFDVITMWDVLEHLPHPTAAVQKAARLLRTGGVLVVRIPHLESLGARVFGRYWAGLDAPRHLHVFPRDVLTDMMRQANLLPIEWQCWGSYHIFALSVQFWLKSRQSGLARSRSWQRLLGSLPLRLLTLPGFTFIDRVLKRGSAVAVVARKASRGQPDAPTDRSDDTAGN
jgi:SAM-dependent methyltransferase